MKMNMPLLAPESGTLFHQKSAGAVMEPGELLATMTLEDPSKVQTAAEFDGVIELPGAGAVAENAQGIAHLRLGDALESLSHMLDGYHAAEERVRESLDALRQSLGDVMLPVLHLEDLLGRLKNAMSTTMYNRLKALTVSADVSPDKAVDESRYFSSRVLEVLGSADSADWAKHAESYVQIENLAKTHADGILASGLSNVKRLLQQYASAEAVFAELELSDDAEKDDLMQDLRRKFIAEPLKVHALALSHQGVKRKNKLAVDLLRIMDAIVAMRQGARLLPSAKSMLRTLGALGGHSTSEVALAARQRLAMLENPLMSDKELKSQIVSVKEGNRDVLDRLLLGSQPIINRILKYVLYPQDKDCRKTMLEMYVRRVYHFYQLSHIVVGDDGAVTWTAKRTSSHRE